MRVINTNIHFPSYWMDYGTADSKYNFIDNETGLIVDHYGQFSFDFMKEYLR